jgi:hypothetical protein
VVFDLDRTLFNPDPRIGRILHEIGTRLNLPTLQNLSRDQISALASGDRTVIGIEDRALLERIFGSYSAGTMRTAEFGRLFYYQASYLAYDEVIPGAPEFVSRITKLLDAEPIYLSGRLGPYFEKETRAQLARFNFPGFGKDASRPCHLLLKPESQGLPNDEFKISEVMAFIQEGKILAVFDDSSRNIRAFREALPESVPVVRISRGDSKSETEKTIRIRDYSSDPDLIEKIIEQARTCSTLPKP